jgi:hypothetical protein
VTGKGAAALALGSYAAAVPQSRVRQVPVPAGGLASGSLSRLDYSDAYAVALPPGVDARALGSAVFASAPAWAAALLAIRHAIVAPLGLVATRRDLERAAVAANGTGDRVGIFPVLAEAPGELLLGLDDRHLDFRISVRVVEDVGCPLVVVSSLVQLNSTLGRAYFTVVKPFHRRILPAMLRRAALRLGRGGPISGGRGSMR